MDKATRPLGIALINPQDAYDYAMRIKESANENNSDSQIVLDYIKEIQAPKHSASEKSQADNRFRPET
jgi:hypothetical protein